MILTEYTSGNPDGSGYNIKIIFDGVNWTEDLQAAFVASADFFSTLITEDVADVSSFFGGSSIRTIDDLEITATLEPIDGVGNVLGSAGPRFIRPGGNPDEFIPITGQMRFDVADAQNLYDDEIANGTDNWTSVVQHEMLHVMGFGTMWDRMGLLTNNGTAADPDYHFTGANAQNEYQFLYPAEYAADPNPALGVPVESSTGRPGSDGGHWTESIFGDELMTPFLDDNSPFSKLTTAALVDMGYTIASYTPTVCFTAGTLIDTPAGPRAIETLQAGDQVLTLDHGARPIAWIGARSLDVIDLAVARNLRPIRISAGALGDNIPATDLLVSPQHRMLVQSKIAMRMFGTDRILVPAVKLLALEGVTRVADATDVTYVHMLFDRHEIVTANGAPSESLFTGAQALKALPAASRAEIRALFPQICAEDYQPEPACMIVQKNAKVAELLRRHGKNGKALVAMPPQRMSAH